MKKFLMWLIGIIVVLVVLNQYWDWPYYRDVYAVRKFNKEDWMGDGGKLVIDFTGKKSSSKSFPSVYGTNERCGMYDDLVKNYLKKGMKLKEVEKLLGKSVSYTYCVDKKIKCTSYGLGTCYASSWTLSSTELTICVNDKQKVIEFRKGRLHREICNEKIIHCMHDETKCDCYIQDIRNGEECSFKVDRW